ncbi:hypothetical protein GCM10010368_57850 [Streptomyces roseiscleroticus]|uniref:Uncharacterized protein n=1 Tax=Streptomyces roseiscleroticus TaxID=1972 RepID=A0ABN3F0S2_9ACTN
MPAAPPATALHATVLTRRPQQSRKRIAAAREEERRRLRRDLPDGLAPYSLGLQLPSLPAAVAVSAYRIAAEALTDAPCHSIAPRCTYTSRSAADCAWRSPPTAPHHPWEPAGSPARSRPPRRYPPPDWTAAAPQARTRPHTTM